MAINIIISSSSEGAGTSSNEQTTTGGQQINTSPQKKTLKAGTENTTDKMVSQLIVQEGKKLLSTAISQYGNLTGDYVTANRLQIANSIASYTLAIAAGGVIGGVMVATDMAINTATSFINLNRENRKTEMLRERAGSSTLNGSRYGYDY